MKKSHSYIIWRAWILSLIWQIPSLYWPKENLGYFALSTAVWQSHGRKSECICRAWVLQKRCQETWCISPPVAARQITKAYYSLLLHTNACLILPQFGSLKSKVWCWQSYAPSRGSRGVSIPCPFQLLLAAGILWLVAALWGSLPPSSHSLLHWAHVCLFMFNM